MSLEAAAIYQRPEQILTTRWLGIFSIIDQWCAPSVTCTGMIRKRENASVLLSVQKCLVHFVSNCISGVRISDAGAKKKKEVELTSQAGAVKRNGIER
jgi:hypothetical protein